MTGATNNFGIYSDIPAGTGRWNLYVNGSADNYIAGSLGIGTTSLTGYSLRLSKNMTGAVTVNGVSSEGAAQSDVTSYYNAFQSKPNTAAASFTLSNLRHFTADQGTIGAGSTVGAQVGFLAGATITGATNNYGFYGDIAAASGRWNLYMNGTADNYLAGSLGIGTSGLTGYKAVVSGTVASSSAVGTGWQNTVTFDSSTTNIGIGYSTSISTAAASYTMANMQHFRAAQGTIGASSTLTNQYGFYVHSGLTGATNNYAFYGDLAAATGRWNLYMNGTANNYMAGSLGIGSTSLSGIGLRNSKTMTGGVTQYSYLTDANIASDVTSTAAMYYSTPSVANSVFTLSTLIHFYANQAQGNFGSATVSSQFGFRSSNTLISATDNRAFFADNTAAVTSGNTAYGFYSAINIATGGGTTWGFYGAGTANNYMAGALGIGSTSLTGYAVRIANAITGSTNSFGIHLGSTIQADVTSNAYIYYSSPNTQATSFTLSNLKHFAVEPGSFGAGSTVIAQTGLFVGSGTTGATNNFGAYIDNIGGASATTGKTMYAYYGNVATASGGGTAWNVYMGGSAPNYIAGDVRIGTTTAGASKLVVNDNSIQINTAKTPSSASDTGTTGQVCWDNSFIYICTATNTWKRSAIASW
jgi:hypothetical protein